MRAIEELTAPEKTPATSRGKRPTTKTTSKPPTRSRSANAAADALPKPIARKLHELEQTARQCDETVEKTKQTLKVAKEAADAAHRDLLDYVRRLTDPDFQPLFKGLDPETDEAASAGDRASRGPGGAAHAAAH